MVIRVKSYYGSIELIQGSMCLNNVLREKIVGKLDDIVFFSNQCFLNIKKYQALINFPLSPSTIFLLFEIKRFFTFILLKKFQTQPFDLYIFLLFLLRNYTKYSYQDFIFVVNKICGRVQGIFLIFLPVLADHVMTTRICGGPCKFSK